jgi:two-component system LytT family response regulator
MAIRTILVDDDFKAIENLKFLIADYCPNINVVGEANNLSDAAEKVRKLKPQLVFLDMQLGNEKGFDLFDHIDLSNCKIVVASAFEDFALKAFQFSAIDYLLKPIQPDLLQAAAAKVEQELAQNDTVNRINSIIDSIALGSTTEPTSQKVAIPTVFGSTFIDYTDIIRCEADKNYTRIYMLKGKPIMSSKNLSEIQLLLPGSIFLRVHHSHVINMNHMEEYHKGKQGYVVMSDTSTVQISQNKKADFIKRLK